MDGVFIDNPAGESTEAARRLRRELKAVVDKPRRL